MTLAATPGARWRCVRCRLDLDHAPGDGRCPACHDADAAATPAPPVVDPGPGPLAGSAPSGATSRDSLPDDPDEPAAAIAPHPGPAAPKTRVLADAPAEGADYVLHDLLGVGGMGEVVAARQVALDRVVALKRVPESVGMDREARRLHGEALITARLCHPNIIPIHDAGVDQQGRPFFAMKKITGRQWSDCFATLGEAANIEILLKVCDAVAFAHAQRIIHRDLKPENIMIGDFGEVLVMDWGLAADIAVIQARTGRRTVSGTPAYMAPEMARGDNARIGPASDIYLLGAILFELLTGKPPHPGDSALDCLQMAARNIIVSTARDDEGCDIARKALATAPADRFESVRAFQDALRALHLHDESNLLCENARAVLARARSSGRHDLYAQAIAGYDQALLLWQGNLRAQHAARESRRSFADHALRAGDLRLAGSLIAALGDREGADDLRLRLDAAHRHRRVARRWNRWLAGIAAAAVAGGLVVAIVAAVHARAEKDQLLAAIHDRDAAELHLAAMEHRAWTSVIAEDFSGNLLPAAIHALRGEWALDGNRLVAAGPGSALAELAAPGAGSLRVAFDLATDRPVAVLFGVDRGDLPDHPERSPVTFRLAGGACAIRHAGAAPVTATLPIAYANLARHVILERDRNVLRVLVDGKPVLRCAEAANPAAIPAADSLRSRLAIIADQGASIGNLRVDRIEDQDH